MKRHAIILAASSLLLASCAEHYVATDTVNRNLDGSRQILTSTKDNVGFNGWHKDSLATPQSFDFRSEKDTMRYAYTTDIVHGQWTLKNDSLPRMLQPEVTVGKSFRWFTTRYRYTARFPQLDSLPVPVDKYLTPDEQKMLFTPNELPSDWTGTDIYDMLDELNTKYVKWWSHCLFEKEMAAYAACCDSTQRALLTQYHDTLLVLVLTSLPNEFKSVGNVSTAFPELEFINKINNVGFDALRRAEEQWNLDTRVLWRIAIPGGRSTEHLVCANRLILGDYVLDEHSDIVNWWACALTLLVIVGGYLLVRYKRRTNSLSSPTQVLPR